MAELSPAAQAVLDAMHRSYDHEPTRRLIAAGILRAAVDQVRHHWDGLECVDHLQSIAAELEGATRDLLEPNDLSHLSEEEFQALAPQGYHGV